jgi:hypothetical protein
VIASATSRVEVRKQGFELLVANFADEYSFWYGILAVGLSLGMGWIAGRLFALV